jgi:WD40 repeat protein
MSRGGLIGGPVNYASNRGVWRVEDTRTKTNLGVGLEEFLVVAGRADPYFYAFPAYQQVDLGMEVANGYPSPVMGRPSFSPDGAHMAICDFYQNENLNCWDMTTGRRKVLPYPNPSPTRAAFIPGTDTIALAPNYGTTIQRISVSQGTLAPITFHTVSVSPLCIAYSPDGTKIAVGLSVWPWLKIVNASTGANITYAGALGGAVWAVAWSPDGTRLAFGGDISGYVKIIPDTSTFSAMTTPSSTPSGRVMGLSWSPDGTKLACAGWRNSWSAFCWYDTATWTRYAPSVLPKTSYGTSVAFSPSGKWVAIGGNQASYQLDGALWVYRVSDWTAYGCPSRLPLKGDISGVGWWNPGLRKAS